MALSRNDKESLKQFLDPDGDLDQPHNLINSFLNHCQDILQISPKSVNKLSNVVYRQTNQYM